MGIGVGIFLIAVGAVLAFAIHVTNTSGIDLHTIGVILMVVGALGLFLGLFVLFWNRSPGVGPPPPAL